MKRYEKRGEPAKVRQFILGGKGLIVLLEDGTLWSAEVGQSEPFDDDRPEVWAWYQIPVPPADRRDGLRRFFFDISRSPSKP